MSVEKKSMENLGEETKRSNESVQNLEKNSQQPNESLQNLEDNSQKQNQSLQNLGVDYQKRNESCEDRELDFQAQNQNREVEGEEEEEGGGEDGEGFENGAMTIEKKSMENLGEENPKPNESLQNLEENPQQQNESLQNLEVDSQQRNESLENREVDIQAQNQNREVEGEDEEEGGGEDRGGGEGFENGAMSVEKKSMENLGEETKRSNESVQNLEKNSQQPNESLQNAEIDSQQLNKSCEDHEVNCKAQNQNREVEGEEEEYEVDGEEKEGGEDGEERQGYENGDFQKRNEFFENREVDLQAQNQNLEMEGEEEEGGEGEGNENGDSNGGDSYGEAESEEDITVNLSTIYKNLQCPICLAALQKTKAVMDCLHRFCKECIETSMRMGYKFCPVCRTHCASRRSLRDDPRFDTIVSVFMPQLEKYLEEPGLDEEAVQITQTQTLGQRSETSSGTQHSTARTGAVFMRRTKHKSDDGEDRHGNDACGDASYAVECSAGIEPKRGKRWEGPSSSQPSLGCSNAEADGNLKARKVLVHLLF